MSKKHLNLRTFVFGSAAMVNLMAVCTASAGTVTGSFTGPLTSDLLLSLDINGGRATTDVRPTEGWNGVSPPGSPQFFPDQYGVTWSPWGGETFSGGDALNWPTSQNGQVGTAGTAPGSNNTTIFKRAFGSITASLSAPGTASSYAAGVPQINSRDRGGPQTAIGGLAAPYNGGTTANANDVDIFRDFIFGQRNGDVNQVQGTNMIQLQMSGLTPGVQYILAMYTYDSASFNVSSWTATPPTTELGLLGWFLPGTNTMSQPADTQTINWRDGAMSGTLRAPAKFTLTADASGTISVWGWGGDGNLTPVAGQQAAQNSYLNAFQLAAVPEPSSLALTATLISLYSIVRWRNREHRAHRRTT
jgi:hypothetical protein